MLSYIILLFKVLVSFSVYGRNIDVDIMNKVLGIIAYSPSTFHQLK